MKEIGKQNRFSSTFMSTTRVLRTKRAHVHTVVRPEAARSKTERGGTPDCSCVKALLQGRCKRGCPFSRMTPIDVDLSVVVQHHVELISLNGPSPLCLAKKQKNIEF